MPPKAKKLGFAKGFTPPTPAQAQAALGAFPFQHPSAATRAEHQPNSSTGLGTWQRPSTGGLAAALEELNEPALYHTAAASSAGGGGAKKAAAPLWAPLPSPVNVNDWLAQYAEDGQTFEAFVDLVSMRSGRFRPSHFGGNAPSAQRQAIGLVPIVRLPDAASGAAAAAAGAAAEAAWPSHGPELAALAEYCEVRRWVCHSPQGTNPFCISVHGRRLMPADGAPSTCLKCSRCFSTDPCGCWRPRPSPWPRATWPSPAGFSRR